MVLNLAICFYSPHGRFFLKSDCRLTTVTHTFAIAYPIVSLLKGRNNSFVRYSLAAITVGIPITYLGGVISMMLVLQVTFWQACVMAVFPFIPGDIAKAVLAAFLGVRINKLYHD